ncbi:flagellar biosynthetic protein FliO [Labrenzia sp. DG1229]|uniref:flagellar biosynthetic protein FliO n=1 Tax=Labrenzia sp. DG1229 TaxID=681847 RepID=UPI000490D4C9|nr:flagellar biosynthetic protein FliO [Labrenzia sp. DG1229]
MYDWIESTFNVSGGVTQVIAVFIALAVVLLLFSLFVFVLKRLMGSRAPQTRNRQPRVAVMDSSPVDARRSLVLIRRDNVEHLLLIGGPTDVVVEQNIVRNAPIAASRQAASSHPTHAGTGSKKVPTAPGPNIPARPDEAVPAPAPVPVVGASSSQTVRQASIGNPRPVQRRSETTDSLIQRSSSLNDPQTVAEPDISSAARPVDKPSGTVRGAGTAADLLRAATQNGFNRSTASQQKNQAEPISSPLAEVEAEAATAKAPDVNPEPSVSITPETGNGGETGSTLKSLARSIATRERSPKTGHTISPPSSGPAARAKTALFKPVDPDAVSNKVEPVMSDPAVNSAGMTAAGFDAAQKPQEASAEPEVTTPTETQDATPQADGPDTSVVVQEDAPLIPATDNNSQVNGTNAMLETASPPVETETQSSAPREVKIDLDLGDLLDDAVSEPVNEPQADEFNWIPDPQVQSQDQENTVQPSQSPATLDIVPGNQRTQPEKRNVQGLGDKNPIEDEMAKILHELGGQPGR